MTDVNASMSRDDLNQAARDAGISDPESFANKDEVIAAINAAGNGDTGDQPEAVQTVPEPDANETVEGGRYRNEKGELVNANGEPLKGGKE